MSNFNIYLERVQESRNYTYDESQLWEKTKREAIQVYLTLNLLLAAAGFVGVAVDQKMQHTKAEEHFQQNAIEILKQYKTEGFIKNDNTLDEQKILKQGPYVAKRIYNDVFTVLNFTPGKINVNRDYLKELSDKTDAEIEKEYQRVREEQRKENKRLSKKYPNRRSYSDSF